MIGEVDLPVELVKQALAFVEAKAKFNALQEQFEALLPTGGDDNV